ncbi:MAG: tyrosine-type recombinase/integrase [Arachnia sp.]
MASIIKRPDGKWRARYRDEAGKEHSRHFGRRVDGQRWLDEVTASVITGQYVDPKAGRVTFAAFVADWSRRQVWEATTRTSFNHVITTVPFSALPLKAIRASHLQAWVKAMSDGGLAASTIHTRVVHVRQVLRAAVKDRFIPTDPSEGLVLPRRRKAEHAMLLPTPSEVAAILAHCSSYFRPYVELCAFAGLRRGEAAAVKVEDIDFLGRKLHVTRQRQRDAVRPPKYGSERTVSLPDDLLARLSAHLAVGVHPEGWLFIGERGPAGDNWGNHQFLTARRAAGLNKVTLHSLRHFYASGLIAAGCDVVTVQRALGHASATTTLNTYSHLWPTAEDRTRAASASIMADVFSADSLRTDGLQLASHKGV